MLAWSLHKHVTVQAGYAHLVGGDVYQALPVGDPDTQFGFLQAHFRY